MSVRPSVRPYTKTQEDNRVRCFSFERVGNQNCENFEPNAQRLTKLEPNEIFNDFAIYREPFDEIDSNFFYF